MVVSAKDLRFKMSMLFDILTKGEETTITYRGKPKAKLVSFEEFDSNEKSKALFGIWRDREGEVDDLVFVEEYFLGHSMQLADALIGATATMYGMTLIATNDKHYKVIKELEIKNFRPL